MLILCLLLAFSHWQLAIGFFLLYKSTLTQYLVSKGSSCNARDIKQRRAVLSVLPFADLYASGSKYPAITTKLLVVSLHY